MNNEYRRKKRGRPAGDQKAASIREKSGKKIASPVINGEIRSLDPTTEQLPIQTTDKKPLKQFGTYLQTLLHHEHTEIAQLARALGVAENTIYRWINGTSVPREASLKQLPDLFPAYQQPLIEIINQTFGDILDAKRPIIQEIGRETYRRVLTLAMESEDVETRFWRVSKAIFEDAHQRLDIRRQGIALTYAKLMPTHRDGIHSLREVLMRGTPPWPAEIVSGAYLGSNTLGGRAASLQQTQLWSITNLNRAPIEIDMLEQSAYAIPITRGNQLAAVLIVSSTQPDFFQDPQVCQIAQEYALLLMVALSDQDYQPPNLLSLRPMPPLSWQREQLKKVYIHRIISYATAKQIPRREADFWVRHELEIEFEREALQQKGDI